MTQEASNVTNINKRLLHCSLQYTENTSGFYYVVHITIKVLYMMWWVGGIGVSAAAFIIHIPLLARVRIYLTIFLTLLSIIPVTPTICPSKYITNLQGESAVDFAAWCICCVLYIIICNTNEMFTFCWS